MAVRYEEKKTPKGFPLLVMYVSGNCDLEQSETLGVRLKKGGDYHRQRVLVFVAAGTEYTPDARKYFPTLNEDHLGMATVVTSAIVRAMINLITRFAGGVKNFKMFTEEAPALAWLDSLGTSG